MSNSVQPHGLYSPWNSLGQNTGGGSCFLLQGYSFLQGIFPTQELSPGLLHYRQILHHLSHQESPLRGGYCNSHYVDEETEAQSFKCSAQDHIVTKQQSEHLIGYSNSKLSRVSLFSPSSKELSTSFQDWVDEGGVLKSDMIGLTFSKHLMSK